MNSKSIAATMGKTGLCVCPNFLSRRSFVSTADDLDAIRARGEFRPAGVGQGANRVRAEGIRNDDIYWLNRELMNAPQALLWRRFDLLMAAFNRELFLGLTDFEGHYAAYPKGGIYKRHKDCFRENSARVVSFVLYLNRDWKPADGGRLRVYAKDQAGRESHIDVNPIGGTMVCFLSGESEHEVLLNHRPRFSMTGWFKRREGLASV